MLKLLVPLSIGIVSICGSVVAVFAIQATEPDLAFTKICRIDADAVITKTIIGKKAAAQLHNLHDQFQSKVDAEKNQITSEYLALPKDAKNTSDAQDARSDLMRRFDDLKKEANEQSGKLNSLRETIVHRLTDIEAPVISESTKSLNCSVLLDQQVVKGGTRTFDITELVIARIDGRYTNIAINDGPPSIRAKSENP